MLVAVAFCPAPPLLVPEVAAGAATELAQLRLACDEALLALLEQRPDEVVVLGGGSQTRERPAGTAGSLAGFGVSTGTGVGEPLLPLSLTVGGWLLDRSEPSVGRAYVEVDRASSSAAAAALGGRLAGRSGRTSLLVMGDGSAARTPKSPVTYDPSAQAYDEGLAAVLAGGEADQMAVLDPAERLAVSGRAAWQVAARAVVAAGWAEAVHAQLLAHVAPYGVGYFVATWLPAARATSAAPTALLNLGET